MFVVNFYTGFLQRGQNRCSRSRSHRSRHARWNTCEQGSRSWPPRIASWQMTHCSSPSGAPLTRWSRLVRLRDRNFLAADDRRWRRDCHGYDLAGHDPRWNRHADNAAVGDPHLDEVKLEQKNNSGSKKPTQQQN